MMWNISVIKIRHVEINYVQYFFFICGVWNEGENANHCFSLCRQRRERWLARTYPLRRWRRAQTHRTKWWRNCWPRIRTTPDPSARPRPRRKTCPPPLRFPPRRRSRRSPTRHMRLTRLSSKSTDAEIEWSWRSFRRRASFPDAWKISCPMCSFWGKFNHQVQTDIPYLPKWAPTKNSDFSKGSTPMDFGNFSTASKNKRSWVYFGKYGILWTNIALFENQKENCPRTVLKLTKGQHFVRAFQVEGVTLECWSWV